MMMLLLKALHIIAMVAWFAGLFYLPRLFVYHVDAHDLISIKRFKVMERRLYYAIMWPAALLTTIFGIGLVFYNTKYYLSSPWFHIKLTLVLGLWGYHLSCGYCLKRFRLDKNIFTARFYRFYNEIPTLLLIGIVFLVILKPNPAIVAPLFL